MYVTEYMFIPFGYLSCKMTKSFPIKTTLVLKFSLKKSFNSLCVNQAAWNRNGREAKGGGRDPFVSIRSRQWSEYTLGKCLTDASGYKWRHSALAKALSNRTFIYGFPPTSFHHVNFGPVNPKSINPQSSIHLANLAHFLMTLLEPPHLSSRDL